MLNTLYKTASWCVAVDKAALPKLIGYDLKVSLKYRFIGKILVYCMLHWCILKTHQVPSLLLMVDFIKAFDSVAWSFIEKSFSKFKFGNDIIQWILTVYININSCVHNILNGLM